MVVNTSVVMPLATKGVVSSAELVKKVVLKLSLVVHWIKVRPKYYRTYHILFFAYGCGDNSVFILRLEKTAHRHVILDRESCDKYNRIPLPNQLE